MGNGENSIRDEILVVIAAALASLETRPGVKLVISAFKRIEKNTPVWNMTGRLERLRRNLSS
jgi:hypothetical protein